MMRMGRFHPRGRGPALMTARPVAVSAFGLPGARQQAPLLPARPYAVDLRGDEEGGPSSEDIVRASTQTVAPIVRELIERSAVEDVEVLRAKIHNQRDLALRVPEPVRTLYMNNVRVLEAKLRAALHARQVELEQERATRTWRVLGYTVTGTGIAVGLAAIFGIVALARRK